MPNTQASAVPARQVVVSEPCGRDWREELLSFPVEWIPGGQFGTALVLVGPAGPVVTQISDICRHPDGSLASARVWCRLDVSADERLTLRLENGDSPLHADVPYFRPGHEGLHEGWIEVGNGLFAVRVPLDGTYAATEVPGPIAAVKPSGQAWIGQGRLEAPHDVAIDTALLESGPLFLKWQTTVRADSEVLATTECVLYAGEPFVHIHETAAHHAGLTFVFNCYPGLQPNRLLTFGGGEAIEQQVRPLDHARPEEIAVVDFNSGNHQMSLAWFGIYREGAEPFLGVMELNGAGWSNVSVNRLHLWQSPPDGLEIRSPLRGGVKEWALVCSTTTLHLKAPGLRECNTLSRLHQRYAEVPLQKIKDWVLDWEEESAARPFSQCAPEDVVRARALVAGDADLQRAYATWPALLESGDTLCCGSRGYCLATLWVAFGDEAFARAGAAALEAEVQLHLDRFWAEGAYMRLLIFDGRSMKLWLQAYDVLQGGGFITDGADRRLRRGLALLAYCFADPEYFPPRANYLDKDDPESFFHGLGQRIGDAICPPNFHTEYYTSYGIMGCCFPGHPRAAHWRAESAELLQLQLEKHFTDAGVYNESPNYHAHVFTMTSQLALALRRSGGPDFFAHPRFKAQFDYFCQMQTPPVLMNEAARADIKPQFLLDAGRDRYAVLPGNGNSGHDGSDMPLPVELAIGAAIYRDSDAALSARCMTTWRRGGRRVLNHLNHLTFLLVADPHLPGTEVDLKSALLTGAYATFRGNPESADEVFVLTKNGTATHHNDFDEGGFTIWAYGAPVASDFGYHAAHAGRHFGTCDTWKHNCVEFDSKSSGYLGIEQSSPPEKWVSTPLADLLVSHIPITNFRDLDHLTYMDQIPAAPIEYRRYTLFVKPHYLLILDSIQECAYSHRWWLHAQATEVTTSGPRAHFKGQFGVDLMAHFIAPETVQLSTGQWGLMRHISAQQTGPKDWRVFVAPLKPGQDFAVSAEDAGRAVHVQTQDYRDTVLLSHFPFYFQNGSVDFRGRAGVVRQHADGRPSETVLLDGDRIETTGI